MLTLALFFTGEDAEQAGAAAVPGGRGGSHLLPLRPPPEQGNKRWASLSATLHTVQCTGT